VLPSAGDISITGVVNEESVHPYLALQTSRLSSVAKMAEKIADCLEEVLTNVSFPIS
jgi:putative sporulation protein YyaC